MPRVAILDDYDHLTDGSPSIEALRTFAEVQVFHQPAQPVDLQGFDGLIAIRERTRFTPELFAALPDLRHIAQTGSGVPHIDKKAAASHGVSISVTPGGSAQAVAELTIGLLLAVVHRIAEGDRAIRQGEWPSLLGTEVGGKSLGLIGLGGIGKEVALRAKAFGLNLLAWSPNLTAERAAEHGCEAVSLDELIARSDFLSIHIRLSDETRGLLSYERLRQAKRGQILINTSRGPIAPGPDLLRALEEGILGGAGLDVFDQEPLPADHPIRSFPNVVLTPHVGWTTRETYERFFAGAVENLRAYYAGAPTNLLDLQAKR